MIVDSLLSRFFGFTPQMGNQLIERYRWTSNALIAVMIVGCGMYIYGIATGAMTDTLSIVGIVIFIVGFLGLVALMVYVKRTYNDHGGVQELDIATVKRILQLAKVDWMTENSVVEADPLKFYMYYVNKPNDDQHKTRVLVYERGLVSEKTLAKVVNAEIPISCEPARYVEDTQGITYTVHVFKNNTMALIDTRQNQEEQETAARQIVDIIEGLNSVQVEGNVITLSVFDIECNSNQVLFSNITSIRDAYFDHRASIYKNLIDSCTQINKEHMAPVFEAKLDLINQQVRR
jgi:hypothetical protein